MGLSLKFLRVLRKSLIEFNNRLTKTIVVMAPKTSNIKATGCTIKEKDLNDWGRKPMRIKIGGKRERVSGILFFTKKSSNLDFVLLEILKKISLKMRLLINHKMKAIKTMIKANVIASRFKAIL